MQIIKLILFSPLAHLPPVLETAQTAILHGFTASPDAQTTSAPQALPTTREIEVKLQNGHFQEAYDEAQRLARAQPRNALAWTYLGMASLHLRRTDQALEAFETAVQISQIDPRPYLNLALLYASKNEIDKAIACYEKGVALDPRNATAYYNYGRLLMAKGQYTEARHALERALQLNSSVDPVRLSMVEVLLRSQQREEASTQVQLLLGKRSLSVEQLVSLGRILVEARAVRLAKQALGQALAKSPQSAPALVQLSKAYLAANDPENAVHAAKQAITACPDSLETNLSLAEALISGRHYPEALAFLLKIQPKFEGSSAFHYTLGIVYSGLKARSSAIAEYEKALQLDPQFDLAYFFLGTMYMADGDLDKAEAQFKEAISLNSRNAWYYSYLMRVYQYRGSEAEEAAFDNAKKAIGLNPFDLDSRLELVKWETDRENLPQARKLLEELISDAPEFIKGRALLAKLYYRLKLTEEAEAQNKVILSLEEKTRKQRYGETAMPRR